MTTAASNTEPPHSMCTSCQRQTHNQPEEQEEEKQQEAAGTRGGAGAYLSTNCYILVDTAVKRRQRVSSSREKHSQQAN